MTGRYSATRPAGREHIPSMPKGFIAIRIVQLVIAVIVLALSGLTLSAWALRSNCLSTFTSIATMAITIYSIVVEFSRDAWKSYNYWAILSLDIFMVIFWLVSFALAAAEVAPGIVCDGWDCYYMTAAFFACLAAIAGLGGVEFVLFIVSLAMHSVAMHRHRAAGLHCSAGSSSAAGDIPGPHNAIPMGGPAPMEKQQPQQQQQQQHQPPVPTYSAAVAPDHQHYQQQPQQQQQPQYPGVVPSPPSAGMYQPPPPSSAASPQSFYPPQDHQQQQQYQPPPQPHQQQQQVGPVGGQFGGGPVPAPHPGSYEVGYQQH